MLNQVTIRQIWKCGEKNWPSEFSFYSLRFPFIENVRIALILMEFVAIYREAKIFAEKMTQGFTTADDPNSEELNKTFKSMAGNKNIN